VGEALVDTHRGRTAGAARTRAAGVDTRRGRTAVAARTRAAIAAGVAAPRRSGG
jgi:hypothetical protein